MLTFREYPAYSASVCTVKLLRSYTQQQQNRLNRVRIVPSQNVYFNFRLTFCRNSKEAALTPQMRFITILSFRLQCLRIQQICASIHVTVQCSLSEGGFSFIDVGTGLTYSVLSTKRTSKRHTHTHTCDGCVGTDKKFSFQSFTWHATGVYILCERISCFLRHSCVSHPHYYGFVFMVLLKRGKGRIWL